MDLKLVLAETSVRTLDRGFFVSTLCGMRAYGQLKRRVRRKIIKRFLRQLRRTMKRSLGDVHALRLRAYLANVTSDLNG